MATPFRRSDAPLEEVLFEHAPRFEFFQAVRLLGRLFPGRRPVGRDAAPADEVVRFTTRPTLAFQPTPVRRLRPPRREDRPAEMIAAELMLTGPAGALPHSYTELLLERGQDRDHALAAFLDLFHHRLLSLFYRAWEKTRPALGLERAWDEKDPSRNGRAGVHDEFSARLFALIGLGMPALRRRHDFPDEALLFYVGLFAQQHRSAAALEALLRGFFGLPIEIIPFVEQTLRLSPADRSLLGGPGGNNRLGVDLIMGEQARDVAGKFRLRIGPLSRDQLREFAPEGALFRRMVQMTRLFVGATLTFDVQLVLRAREVPECLLSSGPRAGTMLGRDSWMKSLGLVEDVGDIILAPGA